MFSNVLSKSYSEEDYQKHFKLRIPELLAKVTRMDDVYSSKVSDTPKVLFDELDEQKKRLEDARRKFGDYISPFELEKVQ